MERKRERDEIEMDYFGCQSNEKIFKKKNMNAYFPAQFNLEHRRSRKTVTCENGVGAGGIVVPCCLLRRAHSGL